MRADKQPKKHSAGNFITGILLCIFSGIFIISVFMIGVYLIRSHRAKEAFDNLADLAGQNQSVSSSSGAAEEEKPDDNRERFHELSSRNKDFIGWISIEGTRVNYPVMYTPTNPEYYLRRDWDGKYSVPGVPFLGYDCPPDSDNVVIYGHNMNDGSMFADVLKYKEKSYWEEHPVIQFDTLDRSGSYEIMAAFYYDASLPIPDGLLDVYGLTGPLTEEEFNEFVQGVRQMSLYDTGIDAVYGDRLVTLSTCSYHTTNGRFLIVGRMHQE